MKRELAAIACCPVHKSPLSLKVRAEDGHGDILAGSLRCDACAFDYPVEEGIPNLLPPEYHLDQVQGKAAAGATKKGKARKGSA